jgi:Protein of unknown function (DUF1570)
MHLPLILLFAAVSTTPTADLSFRPGRLEPWQGEGFYPTTATGCGPSRACGVCSSDDGRSGRKALLHQTFVIPYGVDSIRFTAAAVRKKGCEVGPTLDVALEIAGRKFLTKQTRGADGLQSAPRLLPPVNNRPREYVWQVSAHAGEKVRIALIDEDDRPGCYVFCSGFQFITAEEINGRAFAEEMHFLERKNHLPTMTRLDSEHFMAIGNADDDLIEHRLYNCETIYAIFFDHFRQKGFAVRPPAGRMMVAAFDSQEGFEAYLGRSMSTANTGVYDRESNRLVIYDYARNRDFQAAKKHGDDFAKKIKSPLDRQRFVGAFSRGSREFRDDANIGTVMHEVAHQLSFNGGLLNRDGDVPVWLAEGLACYCESTTNSAWQGVGEPNPMRVQNLAAQVRGKGPFYSLKTLIESDDWLRHGTTTGQIALGYAQSWALYRLLMEEKPDQLRRYLDLIRTRLTPDGRLDDFVAAFGSYSKMEARYQEYIREIIEREAPKRK